MNPNELIDFVKELKGINLPEGLKLNLDIKVIGRYHKLYTHTVTVASGYVYRGGE